MDTLKAIFSRRSVRSFSKKDVSMELLRKLLKAGMYAPSARNTQSWCFVVIQNRERLDQLSEIHPYAKMLKTASASILVCGDLRLEESLIYQVQNCSAATQNILLAAHELGLGGVWLGIQPREDRIQKMKDFFNLPEHIIPISLVAVGFTKKAPHIAERLEDGKIVLEHWQD